MRFLISCAVVVLGLAACKPEAGVGAAPAVAAAAAPVAAGHRTTAREVVAAGEIGRETVAAFAQQVEGRDFSEFRPLSVAERMQFLKAVIRQLDERVAVDGPDYRLLTGLQGACPAGTRAAWQEWIDGVREEDVFWVF